MKSNRSDIQFLQPDVDRDAPFAHSWFVCPEGHATLLSMGNTEAEIEESTLEGERHIMQEFIDLEKEDKQIARVIVSNGTTIGVVWIELFENHNVKPPSIHIMIGNPEFRGKGIGRAAMESAIKYIRETLHLTTVYTRYLANNQAIAKLTEALGFQTDRPPYKDKNGLVWQDVRLSL